MMLVSCGGIFFLWERRPYVSAAFKEWALARERPPTSPDKTGRKSKHMIRIDIAKSAGRTTTAAIILWMRPYSKASGAVHVTDMNQQSVGRRGFSNSRLGGGVVVLVKQDSKKNTRQGVNAIKKQ